MPHCLVSFIENNEFPLLRPFLWMRVGAGGVVGDWGRLKSREAHRILLISKDLLPRLALLFAGGVIFVYLMEEIKMLLLLLLLL